MSSSMLVLTRLSSLPCLSLKGELSGILDVSSFLELRRDSHKVDLDSFPGKNFHDLQNKNKDEDPNP